MDSDGPSTGHRTGPLGSGPFAAPDSAHPLVLAADPEVPLDGPPPSPPTVPAYRGA